MARTGLEVTAGIQWRILELELLRWTEHFPEEPLVGSLLTPLLLLLAGGRHLKVLHVTTALHIGQADHDLLL